VTAGDQAATADGSLTLLTACGRRAADAWARLLASAIPPDGAGPAVARVTGLFGGLGFAELLADPAEARDQCVSISESFASICRHRGIGARTVTGFLKGSVPPFTGEVILCGHTAAEVPGAGGRLAVDWTARQFDPRAPVPLVAPLADWQAFWGPA
jgi:hypothetical protein